MGLFNLGKSEGVGARIWRRLVTLAPKDIPKSQIANGPLVVYV